MLTSHALLLKYRHDPRFNFADVTVWYVDRGAPGDRSCARGPVITGMTDQYLEISTQAGIKYIPFHRLWRIAYCGKTTWERQTGPSGLA